MEDYEYRFNRWFEPTHSTPLGTWAIWERESGIFIPVQIVKSGWPHCMYCRVTNLINWPGGFDQPKDPEPSHTCKIENLRVPLSRI